LRLLFAAIRKLGSTDCSLSPVTFRLPGVVPYHV